MRTKRFVIVMFLCAMVLTVVLGTSWAVKLADGTKLTGKHYNLNIIGVKDKSADMKDTKSHTIFVKLWGKTKIFLTEAPAGESFEVLDRNGTDNDGAKFQLPYPYSANMKGKSLKLIKKQLRL